MQYDRGGSQLRSGATQRAISQRCISNPVERAGSSSVLAASVGMRGRVHAGSLRAELTDELEKKEKNAFLVALRALF